MCFDYFWCVVVFLAVSKFFLVISRIFPSGF